MTLTERKLKILHAIINDFVHSAEPVGSRTISKMPGMDISPATIRNEMSDLEQMGFLTHPHTSAGRMPSAKAYRLYVDDMMERSELPKEAKSEIKSRLNLSLDELDKTMEEAAKLLSEITNLVSFAITPNAQIDKLEFVNIMPVNEETVVMMIVSESGRVQNLMIKPKVPFTEENLILLGKVLTYNYRGKNLDEILKLDIVKDFESDIKALSGLADCVMPGFLKTLENMLNVELYMDGLRNIFSIPEYSDIERAKLMMSMLEKKKELADILVNRDSGIIITIGEENIVESMRDCSLITATYEVNGRLAGKIGVIGPTRMKYSEVTSIVEYMTEHLNRTFKMIEGDND